MTSASDTSASRIILDIFPLGLALGGLLAAGQALLARFASLPGLSEDAISYRVLALAERWPEVLAEALIAGVVCSLVLTFAAASEPRRFSMTAVGVFVTLLATGAFLTGYPNALPGVRPSTAGAALGATLFAFGLSRIPFTGVVPLILGLALGLGLPYGAAKWVKDHDPGMPVRRVVVDLVSAELAGDQLLEIVSQRPGAPVGAAVLTPVVDQRTDTGDKPAIILPAPAAVQFIVPAEADGTRFHAAVNLDESSITRLPQGMNELPVTYRVLVDNVVKWEETIQHRYVGPGWNTEHMVWRYVSSGGERGVPVLAGQTVRLETALGEGVDDSELGADQLKLGFGGASLVRETRKPRRVATPHSPNVVYIVIDTQRRDRLGCYGYERDVTPNIDQLARKSVLFEDAYTTSSWTWPSTASLLTSLPPDAHGVKSSASCTLDQSLTTIAEALQQKGYTTAAFVGNPIVSSTRYFDQGFETFDETLSEFRRSDTFMPDALDWLETYAPLRFFLYLHLVDPHTPHRPSPLQMERLGLGPAPEEWPESGLDGIQRPSKDRPGTKITPALKEYANELYDASVATSDMWIGRLLDKLDELQLDDRTVIVLTTDHGEELLDRGFRGHGHTLYPELVRAPLLIHAPGVRLDRRQGVVSNRHAPTTIAALCDVPLPGFGLQVDLLNDRLPDEAFFETTKGEWGSIGTNFRVGQQLFGVRRGSKTTQWRYEVDKEVQGVAASDFRIFDVQGDPTAVNDMISIAEDEARDAAERIKEFVEAARAVRPRGVAGVGKGGADVLQQIGYSDRDEEDPDKDE